MRLAPVAGRHLLLCIFVALVIAGCSGNEVDRSEAQSDASEPTNSTEADLGSSPTEATTTAPPTTVEATVAPTTTPPATAPIAWGELPPIDTPAELVPENYDGRFLAYANVIDEGDAPILCTPVIAESNPPQCGGVPLDGWDWATVEHDELGETRWGQYVIIGRWDGLAFTLTEPAFPVDWANVNTQEPDPVDLPCIEPEGGWWADVSNPERLGPDDYNAAIGIINTRPELVSIDIVEPQQARPPEVQLDLRSVQDGWIPGILVIQLTTTRDGDEAAIREHWGGPLCLTEGEGLNRRDLTEIEDQVFDLSDEIAPVSGIFGLGSFRGQVQVDLWVANVESQARLDEQFGPGVVRLMGLLWAID